MLCRGRFPCLTVLVTLALLGLLLAPAAAADSTAPAQRVAAAWGFDDHGQLGATTNRTCRVLYDRLPCSPVPLQVSGLGRVRALAAGAEHSLALGSDGTVWAWGWNNHGQLGNPLALCSGFKCETSSPIQVGGLQDIAVIAAGGSHSLAARRGGAVYAWGDNTFGQLGIGRMGGDQHHPVRVSNLGSVVALAGGSFHSLAVKSDGTVWAWGYNGSGELGDGTTTERLTPVQVVGLSGVIAVAAGAYHSLALTSDGTVWSWGRNEYGQLGNGTITPCPPCGLSAPVQAVGVSGVTTVAAGAAHTLALKSDGTVLAWGDNELGQLGDGTTNSSPVAVSVKGLRRVAAISAGRPFPIPSSDIGGWHSLAIVKAPD